VIVAVIDTNVLVSAMISRNGNEALLLIAVSQGLIVPCFSADVLEEYFEVLQRPRFGFPRNEVDALLDMLRGRGRDLGSVRGRIPEDRISPDPDDDKFIACVLAGNAQFLVTGNKKHFPENALAGARVVSAGELLGLITLEL
jgi:uncharacterized protein